LREGVRERGAYIRRIGMYAPLSLTPSLKGRANFLFFSGAVL
jgi:hypothetical protein